MRKGITAYGKGGSARERKRGTERPDKNDDDHRTSYNHHHDDQAEPQKYLSEPDQIVSFGFYTLGVKVNG